MPLNISTSDDTSYKGKTVDVVKLSETAHLTFSVSVE